MPLTSSSCEYEAAPKGATDIHLLLEDDVVEMHNASRYGADRLRTAPRSQRHFWQPMIHTPGGCHSRLSKAADDGKRRERRGEVGVVDEGAAVLRVQLCSCPAPTTNSGLAGSSRGVPWRLRRPISNPPANDDACGELSRSCGAARRYACTQSACHCLRSECPPRPTPARAPVGSWNMAHVLFDVDVMPATLRSVFKCASNQLRPDAGRAAPRQPISAPLTGDAAHPRIEILKVIE